MLPATLKAVHHQVEEQMQGKFKAKSKTSAKWVWSIIFLIGLASAFGIWKLSTSNQLELEQNFNLEPVSTIPNSIKEKRIAVMVFKNLTMNPSMDAFGKMTSDWITKGLMETRKVNVISGANI